MAFVVGVEVEIAAVGAGRGDAEAEAKAKGQRGESLGDGNHREVSPERLTQDFKRGVKEAVELGLAGLWKMGVELKSK